MAERPEALVQIARLLGDDGLRHASDVEVAAAVEHGFSRLADALVDEAAASDDVIDRKSALVYLDDRLSFLGALLEEGQRGRLREALVERVAGW
jgi:hypothetical protein